MSFTGKVHRVGDHIDTDAIIPTRYLVTTDTAELAKGCMEGLEPGWIKRVSAGDIMVAGKNFGCGSSREHAPLALIGAGIKAVVAHSFARIFYRNAFNMGLMVLEVGDAAASIADGDELEIDTAAGIIRNLTQGTEFRIAALSPMMQTLLDKGGMVNYVRGRLAEKRAQG